MAEETAERDSVVDCVCVSESAAESVAVTPGVALVVEDAEPGREAEVVDDPEKDAVLLELVVEEGEMDVVFEAKAVRVAVGVWPTTRATTRR